jgi:hypothetical protein
MIENSTLSVGGNTILVYIGIILSGVGKWLTDWGEHVIMKHKTKMVTNPSFSLINPFTLIINFTVDVNDKYQIILQGDYKENYKELQENNFNLTENELFIIINSNRNLWFKKY